MILDCRPIVPVEAGKYWGWVEDPELVLKLCLLSFSTLLTQMYASPG